MPNWKQVAGQDLWTLHEAACYIGGIEPAVGRAAAEQQVLGDNSTTIAGQVYRGLKDALLARTLPIIVIGGWYGFDRIKPLDAIQWALGKAYAIPDPLSKALPKPKQPESRLERGKRLAKEKQELIDAKTRNWLVVLVQREGIGRTRIKELISEAGGKRSNRKIPNQWSGLAGLAGRGGQKRTK